MQLSYLWYVATGCAIVLIVGSAVSFATQDASTTGPVDRALLASCVRRNEDDALEEAVELHAKSLSRVETNEASQPLK